MTFEDADLLTERKEYTHRPDYKGNEKGSYIKAGKTIWSYRAFEKPGNERIVTQIQNKAWKEKKFYSRQTIKDWLKSEDGKKAYESIHKAALRKFGGEDEDDPKYRAYVYGGLATAATKALLAWGEKK